MESIMIEDMQSFNNGIIHMVVVPKLRGKRKSMPDLQEAVNKLNGTNTIRLLPPPPKNYYYVVHKDWTYEIVSKYSIKHIWNKIKTTAHLRSGSH